jgi:tRNA A-37 threonylcarbamoyl transferase component Bud32
MIENSSTGIFPFLRLREPTPTLIGLPWELPLGDWSSNELRFRELPVGPSRHLVRFLQADGRTYALKEEPLDIARREYEVLRQLEEEDLPAVVAVGIAEADARGTAILVTEFLLHSLQYRRLLMRFPAGPNPQRDRLLDAMATLLVDLHRAGVYWGDCSLANTLFRRDGDRVQAYLVDAETSEIHPKLSDGQRAYDLDVLVENVGFGLADLAAFQGRDDLVDDAIEAAESVRARYRVLWEELHSTDELTPDDRHAVASRIRRLNDLGFAIDEILLEPGGGEGRLRLRVAVTNRQFHSRELRRRTGLVALEGQARILLNDLREYEAWVEFDEGRSIEEIEAGDRWIHEVLEPTLRTILPVVGPARDPLQAYCDLLETKWLLSERAGKDVGLAAALEEYLAAGAPAPEDAPTLPDADISLDIDWQGPFDRPSPELQPEPAPEPAPKPKPEPEPKPKPAPREKRRGSGPTSPRRGRGP